MLGPWQSQLCDIQGRLFENAGKAGYNSEQFIKQFMTSSLAKELDSTYNRMQWAGEEYGSFNIRYKNVYNPNLNVFLTIVYNHFYYKFYYEVLHKLVADSSMKYV